MFTIPEVVKNVVNQDICIGCGACIDACPSKALSVQWNSLGFIVATGNGNDCESDGACLEVCPFNPFPGPDGKNEDDLSALYLGGENRYHQKIGRFLNIYAGYARKFRDTSSSGGIATYVYEKLFEKGFVDHVVTVGSANNNPEFFEYKVISSRQELRSISKTRYYPVSMANALEAIRKLDGRVAISGVGCFIKAIRLAQEKDPLLKEKISFLVGIICGGVKSRFFTEYLADKAGATGLRFYNPEYRVKNSESTASDYGFSCIDIPSKTKKTIKMSEVGDMWGTGLFKANACDYCDDVTTELSDISLGDAWLNPYDQDGNGHNVIVSRSVRAEEILKEGAISGEVQIEELQLEKFLVSQQGSFNHRHDGLGLRIAQAQKKGLHMPLKRVAYVHLPLHIKLVQLARQKTRSQSLKIWSTEQNADRFDRKMKRNLMILRALTKLSHFFRRINKIRGRL